MRKSAIAVLCVFWFVAAGAAAEGIPGLGAPSFSRAEPLTLEQGFASLAGCNVHDHFYDASTQPPKVPAFLRNPGGKPSTVNETANFRVTDTLYGLPVSEVRLTYTDVPKYGVVFDRPVKVVQEALAKRNGGKFDRVAKFRDGSVRKLEDLPGGRSHLGCWYPMGD